MRDYISQNSYCLIPCLRNDSSVRMPYTWDKISEAAKHGACMALITGASKVTAPYYTRGRYFTNVGEEDWVAKWYLWHSFRYRLVHISDGGITVWLTKATMQNRDYNLASSIPISKLQKANRRKRWIVE